jgi:hypothetical protein
LLTNSIQLGRTKVLTRFELFLRALAMVVGLLGAAVSLAIGAALVAYWTGAGQVLPAITIQPVIGGDGPLLDPSGTSTAHIQSPIAVSWPTVDPWWPAVALAAVLTMAWVKWVVAPLLRRVTGENLRHRGLASASQIRRRYGTRQVRKAWRYALPGSTWAQRIRIGTSAMGIHFGEALTPAAGGALWVNLEQRVRIIARPGWGKTTRLLVPIIRQLAGPVLVSSTEPEIFTSTVLARTTRRLPGRFGYRSPARTYPVAVVDCSPGNRITGGKYETVRWNPIPGCEDFAVATRRAQALMKGVDDGQAQDSAAARYFEEVASAVVAAMLHAAALSPGVELEDIGGWIATSTYSTADAVLSTSGEELTVTVDAEPVALMSIRKFLDKAGGRTTVQVEASVLKGISSMLSLEGRRICGSRKGAQFDMTGLIRAKGTMYLLGEPDRMRVVRPLLSMIASEVFVAAEQVARASGGRSPAFYAVLDELRSGVRVATLPDIASEKRKFRIGYVYACTNGGDEAALYGEADAARLRAAAGTSIYGGLDPQSMDDITERAGRTDVVRATRSATGARSETPQEFDTLTAADMQQLADGESVIVGRDLPPFLAVSKGVHEIRSLRRQIHREAQALETQAVTA